MSLHKKPLTDLELKGLQSHGIVAHIQPTLTRAFLGGMAWAAAHRSPEWIAITDELPSRSGFFETKYDNAYEDITEYSRGLFGYLSFWETNLLQQGEVTHWRKIQPLTRGE